MGIKTILNQWGIIIPNEYDRFEYLCSIQPENCYFIDRFPLLIKDFEKYQQEEIFYDKVLNKEISEETFKSEEAKFVNVIKKLWLYNPVFLETNLLEIENKTVEKIFVPEHSVIINSLKDMLRQSRDRSISLEDSAYLDLLIRLGTRETVYSTLAFLDYKMVVIGYSMCFQVYLNDLSKLQLIKEIVSTEGLYLRPYIHTMGITQ